MTRGTPTTAFGPSAPAQEPGSFEFYFQPTCINNGSEHTEAQADPESVVNPELSLKRLRLLQKQRKRQP